MVGGRIKEKNEISFSRSKSRQRKVKKNVGTLAKRTSEEILLADKEIEGKIYEASKFGSNKFSRD
jgi:hypothetical protein